MITRLTLAIIAFGIVYAGILAAGGTDAIADRVAEHVTAWQAQRATVIASCRPAVETERLVIITDVRNGRIVAVCTYVGSQGTYYRKPRT
ncbi:MAG: hypothetical protein EPO27_10450 [Betaproteobacteria bacterium]|nr:MAG: hypothetical protein EPO27_10450 [Betaproteobacteria bacterium]